MVEPLVYTEGVGGSNPSLPTSLRRSAAKAKAATPEPPVPGAKAGALQGYGLAGQLDHANAKASTFVPMRDYGGT